MKYLVCLVIIALIIGLCVCIYKEVTSSRITVRDAGDLQRYKNRGLRRVGREPDIWHYPDGEIGLTLKYVRSPWYGRSVVGYLVSWIAILVVILALFLYSIYKH